MTLHMKCMFLLMNIIQTKTAKEPSCPACSRYDYEERLLERVLRNEIAMETILKEIRETNVQVESALKLMHGDKHKLEATLNDLQKSKEDMGTKLNNALTTAMTNISNAVSEMTQNATMTALQLRKDNNILKDQLTIPLIYFHVHTPADSSLDADQVVVYTNVLVNEGQGYDPKTGRFTVSVPGLYAFTVTYLVYSSTFAGLTIVHQGTEIQGSYLKPGSGNYASTSSPVFIRANMSDQIWVKTTHGSSQLNIGATHNYFTGALIHL